MVCLFHFLFKALAFAFYMTFWIFISDKTLCYIFVITCCAFDFWTVKNVSGRILVGLRWWSVVDDSGKETWHYESLQNREINIIDYRVFWYTQYFMGVVWTIMAIVALFSLSLENLTVCIVA